MLSKLLKRFKTDRRGNFALVTIFAFPAVFASVALSIDVANVLRLRTELQNANDTGALFATRYYQVNNKLPTNQQVQEFVQANYTSGVVSKVGFQFDRATNKMTVTSDAATKPFLMNYFGFYNTEIAALSQATLGLSGSLEFALALDTTESMLDDNRIGGLKSAANNFVDILFDMKDRGADVKGAIVPFTHYVNVGKSRRNEAWMNVPRDIDNRKTETVCRVERPVIGQTNCRMVFKPARVINHPATPASCVTVDGFQRCTPGKPAWTENVPAKNQRVCDNVYGAAVETCRKETTGSVVTWNGCVSSRAYPLNVTDAYNGSKFPGVLGVTCAPEVQPLTATRSKLTNKINSLVPSDNTYIPEGVMWGMRMLTDAEPFTDAKPATGNARPVRKALVVMTDGKNTLVPMTNPGSFSANNIIHYGSNNGSATPTEEALANRYTTEACDAAKAEEIEVYTISFGNQVPNNIRSLLEDCASKPQLYFHASDSAGLNDAFSKIADELLSIRLTQ